MKKGILHVGHAGTALTEALIQHMLYLEGQKPVDIVFALHDSYEPEELGIRRRDAEMIFPPIIDPIPQKLDFTGMSERQARRKAERKLTGTVKAKYKGKTNPFKK